MNGPKKLGGFSLVSIAYNDVIVITAVKCFIVQPPRFCNIKLFTVALIPYQP
jgi:hypothetical protein